MFFYRACLLYVYSNLFDWFSIDGDEEDDEEVVGVPEPFKVGTASLLHCEPHHDAKGNGHNPASRTRSGDEVGGQESDNGLARGGLSRNSQLVEIDHVGKNVDGRADNDGPGGSLVEGDILVEGDDVVQRCATQNRNEVPADRQEDEDDIDMENECSSTCGCYWIC